MKKCPRYGTCCKIGAKTKTYTITVIEGSRREHQEFENSDYFMRSALFKHSLRDITQITTQNFVEYFTLTFFWKREYAKCI